MEWRYERISILERILSMGREISGQTVGISIGEGRLARNGKAVSKFSQSFSALSCQLVAGFEPTKKRRP